ncbi:MAG: uracil-DNA glycosylase [Patescibacteria group bacterium]
MIDLEKEKELNALRHEVSSCLKCSLCKTRMHTVFGEGNSSSSIMFVGEAPGAKEDLSGIPFCGAAGKFLDEMLIKAGLDRSKVYIANTLKCRPPENRDPEESEKTECKNYLLHQIEIIKPALIVCLGRHATREMLPGMPSISKIHGHALKRLNGIVYLPLYHPAAALHNGALRKTLIDDFMKIPVILGKLGRKAKSLKLKAKSRGQIE